MLPWAIAALPDDDLLSVEEWTGLAGIVAAMLPYAACEDYDWELRRLGEDGRYIDKGHLGRKICYEPGRFMSALKRLGQPTLAVAFADAWPEARA